LDRDLNWLEFNRRVLNEALDERTPLLERVNFLAIFTSNLDEFVMKRVYGLREQVWAGVKSPESGVPSSESLLHAIHAIIQELLNRQAEAYQKSIKPALVAQGIHLLGWNKLTDEEQRTAAVIFDKTVFPVLIPLSVDMGHPFPFISNLSLSLGLTLNDPATGQSSFARVKIPDTLPQWIRIETSTSQGSYRFVSLVDLIAHHLDRLFPDMKISGVMPFRVTRNAEVDADLDDVQDLLQAVQEQVLQRRMECVVRLECPPGCDPGNRRILTEALELGEEDVYVMPGLVEYRSLRDIAALPFPALRFKPWTPLVPRRLQGEEAASIFDVIRAGDLLVQHPYESFDDTILRLVRDAVEDPAVLAIKMTLYRTGKDSPFVPLLIRAAELGKQVACLVELKARFDEHENILLAQRMERAGVHVVYGVEGLKTHTKTTLVVRREEGEARCYAHIGTGNYHRHTARLYVDTSLLTCRPDLTADVADLFNYLTGRNRKVDYRKLLVAPATMKPRFLEMIRREQDHRKAGRPAHILAKMNQLEDRDICNALYAASQAGVPVDLIIRGFCTLKPGVPGLSDNIRVISIIGRFLEHARIYHFRNGAETEGDGEYYIGSADWMHRNLESRVEAIVPIEDPALKAELQRILNTHLADQRNAWDMQADGTYTQRKAAPADEAPAALGSHELMMRHALRCHG
jgi:polyphosphate kinase